MTASSNGLSCSPRRIRYVLYVAQAINGFSGALSYPHYSDTRPRCDTCPLDTLYRSAQSWRRIRIADYIQLGLSVQVMNFTSTSIASKGQFFGILPIKVPSRSYTSQSFTVVPDLYTLIHPSNFWESHGRKTIRRLAG